MRDRRWNFPRTFKWWVLTTLSKTSKLYKSAGLQFITLVDISNNVFLVINPVFYPIKLGYSFTLQQFRLYLPPDFLSCRVIECSINFKNPHSVSVMSCKPFSIAAQSKKDRNQARGTCVQQMFCNLSNSYSCFHSRLTTEPLRSAKLSAKLDICQYITS